jgi:uncharacterized protein (TIGR00255 family)
MTGYGFGETSSKDFQYQCEIRSLNSRFIEVNVRLPRSLIALEPQIIGLIKKHLNRGKVDVFVDISKTSATQSLPELDTEALGHYLGLFEQLEKKMQGNVLYSFASLRDPAATEILALDGMLKTNETKTHPDQQLELHGSFVNDAALGALAALKKARITEGEELAKSLRSLLGELEISHGKIAEKTKDLRQMVHDAYKKRLSSVISLLNTSEQNISEPSEERLLSEIIILTEKADVEEELVRYKSHHDEFLKLMDIDEAVGRKLDFICQEMHREVNTISNKLQLANMSPTILDMKQAVERLRQQIQNIE